MLRLDKAIILIFLIQSFHPLISQSAITIGQSFTIESKILNETRTYLISYPESYFESTFRYPVLYLLDAESDFKLASTMVAFLSITGKIPEMLVIGIENTKRSRDLTPKAPNDIESKRFWGEIGGADNFKQFLKAELFPHIDSTYRTNNYRILRGQSFGGLFGLYDLSQPDPIFNSYILSSPSARWNENMLFTKLKVTKFNKEKIFIGEAEFDWSNDNGIKELVKLLSENIDKQKLGYMLFEGEGHYSLVMNCTENGLRFIYENYPLGEEKKKNLTDMKRHYELLSEELGYSIETPMNEIIRLANHHLRNKNWKKGIAIAKENMRLYPNQPQTYWHVGDAYSLMGDKKSANNYFKQALEKAKELNLADLSQYKDSLN